MLSTNRPTDSTTPRPRYSLRPDKSAVLIRQAVQASRIAKELGDTQTEWAYLETAKLLLDFRIEAVRAELGR